MKQERRDSKETASHLLVYITTVNKYVKVNINSLPLEKRNYMHF